MSLLSKKLTKGEELIFEEGATALTLIMPILCFIVLSEFSQAPGEKGLAVFLALIDIIWLIRTIIRIFTNKIGLSNKRLVGKTGLINIKSMDSPLDKINSVSISQGIAGRIFKYGTITVNTASTIYYFKSIKNADDMRNLILDAMEKNEELRVRNQAEQIATAMNLSQNMKY